MDARVAWTTPSQPHDRAPPWLDRLPDADGRTRARLVAPWADRAMIAIDDAASVRALWIGGEPFAAPAGRTMACAPVRLRRDGVELALAPAGDGPVTLRLVACGPRLPADVAAFVAARDAVATTSQWGDAACVVATETW